MYCLNKSLFYDPTLNAALSKFRWNCRVREWHIHTNYSTKFIFKKMQFLLS